MLGGAIFLALLAASQDTPDFKFVSDEQMHARLEACGLQEVEIRYDEMLQTQVATIEDAEVDGVQLRCAFDAQDMTFFHLEWPAEIAPRFQAISDAVWKPRFAVEAKKYFAANPDLATSLERRDGQSDEDYGRQVARACDSGMGFIVFKDGGLTVAQENLSFESVEEAASVMRCALHASVLTDIPFGFVANGHAENSKEAPE